MQASVGALRGQDREFFGAPTRSRIFEAPYKIGANGDSRVRIVNFGGIQSGPVSTCALGRSTYNVRRSSFWV